ncbi:MAG: nickel/cobalt efflux transporter RcnA [Rhodospirillaceae bacterium]|nr:nickel/cobalt efflux transporter RcnA [Rhodospirillaceae bacterium]
MDLISLIEAGASSPLTLFFAALLLGGLHGLEPGHSKTMMAAFIIAVRGTPAQAALLGVSAALSHTVIVWVLAILALLYGDALIAERLEPWFMIGSGLAVVVMGGWIFLRSRSLHHHNHDHGHHHDHDHDHDHDLSHVGADDAHARSHAAEIERRFAGGSTTTAQTILFGLTGGMIPCPAAITVLILCLHLKKFTLGIILVSAFSFGLALTLVAVGMATAIGLRYARARTHRLDALFAAAPYVSALLIGLIGAFMAWSGYVHLGE